MALPAQDYAGPFSGVMMLAVGVLCGFAAALAQSISYFASRFFVLRRGNAVFRLVVLGHLLMGLISAAALPLIWPERMPPLGGYLRPLVLGALFYMLGQVCLFLVMRYTEASRASPLLGLKIVILAAIGVLFPHQQLTPWQWTAVLLAVAAAFMLNYAGLPLPGRAVAGILGACLFYSLSDLNIGALMKALAGCETWRASFIAVALSYALCGVAALALLPLAGRSAGGVRTLLGEWPYALPFATSWLAAMFFLFACFALIGVLYGNIIQSTRGLITIVLGAAIAHGGGNRLERKVRPALLARRLGAAAMMCLAIVLYLVG